MAQPTKLRIPPGVTEVEHVHRNLYMVKGSATFFRTIYDADKGETTTRPVELKYSTVIDADKQEITCQQDVKKPPLEAMTVRRMWDLNFFKGTPMIEKCSVVDANKQRDTTSNPETKINMDQHVKRSKPQVVAGSSGKLLVASSKTLVCSRREAKMNMLKMRRDFVYHRVFLHLMNISLHMGNLCGFYDHLMGTVVTPDPQVVKFMAMRFRYFTTWVVMLHIFYSATALTLQLYRHNQRMKKGNPDEIVITEKPKLSVEGLFRSIIWPSSLVVTIFFWSVFCYDRELIFPKFVDQVVCVGSNHIFHTWITIFVFFEVLFKPRIRPLTVAPNLCVMFMFMVLYLSVFYYTLFTENIWLYPIFSVAYQNGIIYFLLLHLVLLVLFLLSYAALWTVNDLLHKHRLLLKKKTRYFSIHWGSEANKKRIKGNADLYRSDYIDNTAQ